MSEHVPLPTIKEKTLNIDQMLWQLEQQKESIERAISALKDISGRGPLSGRPVTRTTNDPGKKRRGRPPKKQPLTAESSIDSADQTSPREAATTKRDAKARLKRPVYTDDFRRGVVAAVRDGMSFGDAAREFKTTWFSVREWANSGRFEPGSPDKSGAKKAASVPRKNKAKAKKTASSGRTTRKKRAGRPAGSASTKSAD
ncbi:MAG TPA: hypothetical protein VES20_11695 [Bryobacteraceae bacterium]|nr:hypothetical protein [Bryobacteraceae bacterium]